MISIIFKVILFIDFKLLNYIIWLLIVGVTEIHCLVFSLGCWTLQLLQLIIVVKQEITVVFISQVELVKLKLFIKILNVHYLLKIIFRFCLTLGSLTTSL